jgi:hypothetical protein
MEKFGRGICCCRFAEYVVFQTWGFLVISKSKKLRFWIVSLVFVNSKQLWMDLGDVGVRTGFGCLRIGICGGPL